MAFQRNSGRHRRPLFAFQWVLVGIAVAVIVRVFVVQVYLVPSPSMQPALQVGDRVAVDKLSGSWRDVRRGDIVVFDATDVWGPSTNGLLVAKRVVGLPGDRITCCNAEGKLLRNGVALSEPFAHGQEPVHYDIVVPADRLWVLGDNRSHSVDSAASLATSGGGSVPVTRVLGRAVAVVWPLHRAGILGLPASKDSHDAA